jgi:HSP20 family protein
VIELRKRPSIFDLMDRIFEDMERRLGFPRGRPFALTDPFEELKKELERFEAGLPEDLVREIETPRGRVKEYGPFYWGFSYTHRPGEEPVIKEFGNIRPTRAGFEPILSGEREPFVDVIDEKERYVVAAELPGAAKEEIELNAGEDWLEIRTTGKTKYAKKLSFGESIDPESAKATFKNGVLEVTLDKKAKPQKGKKINIS